MGADEAEDAFKERRREFRYPLHSSSRPRSILQRVVPNRIICVNTLGLLLKPLHDYSRSCPSCPSHCGCRPRGRECWGRLYNKVAPRRASTVGIQGRYSQYRDAGGWRVVESFTTHRLRQVNKAGKSYQKVGLSIYRSSRAKLSSYAPRFSLKRARW